jgi:DNA-binding MarR family transcriptional regulator
MRDMADDCGSNPFGLLVELADRLRAFLDRAAVEEGLTAQQAQVVLSLAEPAHMSELAGRKLCDPSSVTAMVKRLERGGFVERIVDAGDRRARLVRLTPKGRRVRARLETRLAGAGQVIDALDDAQRHALAALFAGDRASR